MVLQHEHQLNLIDLNPKYPHDEEVYDDEEDLTIKQAFEHSCDLCNEVITFLHKYYYKYDQCEYSLHKLCKELPKTLEHASHNQHTLALLQVKPNHYCDVCKKADQLVKFYPKCRICNKAFLYGKNCWIYKCDKCRYYVHLDCAYLRDVFQTSKKSEDDPSSLHLPLSDHTYNMIKDIVFKETNERIITLNSHEHPLLLVDKPPTSSDYNECNACLIPIKNTTFYKCCAYGCNFVLHDWCTRLPVELKDSKGHPQHTLLLLPKVDHEFTCHVCNNKFGKGFAYSCVECGYDIDLICAFIGRKITHKAHPYHRLSRRVRRSRRENCHICLSSYFSSGNDLWMSCKRCNFNLHLGWCALLLPETIRHKYDKHPMTLCYTPAKNHEGDYFCEVCEELINPNASFYHCHECDQSLHTECAPLIPQTKAYIHAASRVPDRPDREIPAKPSPRLASYAWFI
ncbi:hypothetical protein R6Q59_013150 [Mikania micrantha]